MAKLKTCLNQRALRNQKTRQGPQNPQKQFYPSCASPPEARTRVIGMHTRASRAMFSANAAHSSLSCDVISALKQLKGSTSPGKVSEKARKPPSRQVFTSHERRTNPSSVQPKLTDPRKCRSPSLSSWQLRRVLAPLCHILLTDSNKRTSRRGCYTWRSTLLIRNRFIEELPWLRTY